MLDVLRQYTLEGKFPQNTFHSHRQPYFIDIYGIHCAVGYLLLKSGHGKTAREISKSQNYAYVREIRSAELIQWSIDYGFTIDELAWIQPAYPDATAYKQIGSGTNGRVKSIDYGYDYSNSTASTYIAGDFTMLGDLPCLNVAAYESGQLSCLGGGIQGKVNVIKASYFTTKSIYVAGRLEHNNTVYPLAKFENNEWTYLKIGNSTIEEATALEIWDGAILYVSGIDSQGKYLNFRYQLYPNLNEWDFTGELNGPVYTISCTENGKIVHGGKFDQIISHKTDSVNSLPQLTFDTIITKNIAIFNEQAYNYEPAEWTGITENVPDTVFASVSNFMNVYIGGSASTDSSKSNILLSGIINNVAQPLILLNNQVITESAIYSMAVYGNSQSIAIGGNLSHMENGSMIMYYGKNLFNYHIPSGGITSLGYFNNTVFAVNSKAENLIIGGDFTENPVTNTQLLHLAEKKGIVHTNELSYVEYISVFPNPASNELALNIPDGQEISFEITDVQGKIIIPEEKYTAPFSIKELNKGIYFINLLKDNKQIKTLKFIKT